MSGHLNQMKVGDKIKMEGPYGQLNYQGSGNFILKKNTIKKTKIGLISGGSGITPCYQIIQAASLANDTIDLVLLYTNKNKSDILINEALDDFARVNKNLRIFHTLTRYIADVDFEWHGLKGRITPEMLKQCGFPEPSLETLIVYCGPPGMNKTVEEILGKLGYTRDMIHKF